MIVAACPGVLRHWGAFPGGDVGWAGTGGSAPSTVSATAQFSFCGAGGNRGAAGANSCSCTSSTGSHQGCPSGSAQYVTLLVPQGPSMDSSKKVDLKIIIIGALG